MYKFYSEELTFLHKLAQQIFCKRVQLHEECSCCYDCGCLNLRISQISPNKNYIKYYFMI